MSGSFLYQPTLATANCKRLTISGWFRLAAPVTDGTQFSASACAVGVGLSKVRYSFWEFGGINTVRYSVDGIHHEWQNTGIVTNWNFLYQNPNAYSVADGPIWAGNTTTVSSIPGDADDTSIAANHFGFAIVASNLTNDGPVYERAAVSNGSSSVEVNAFSSYSSRLFVTGQGGSYKFNCAILGTICDRAAIAADNRSAQAIVFSSPDGTFTFGNWHHVIVAIDVGNTGFMVDTTASSLNGGSKANKAWMVVNGVASGSDSKIAHEQFVGGFAFGNLDNPPVDANPGIVVSGFPFSLPFNAVNSDPAEPDRDNPLYVGNSNNYDWTQPFKAREFADVQVWFDTYIDPTVAANYAKFVNISDGIGRPVKPSTAAAAFGTQDILLHGNAANFVINRGGAGTFRKINTINNFTPVPSYA